jgi:tyrosine-specific transport protein
MMNHHHKKKYLLAVSAMFCGNADAFTSLLPQTPALLSAAVPTTTLTTRESANTKRRPSSSWSLKMQPSSKNENKVANKRRLDTLSASFLADEEWSAENSSFNPSVLLQDLRQNKNNLMETTLLPVLTTSLMITGNTVGAGMLVLPELAAGPGMGISTSIFAAAFLINLISGLLIAEVAIHQHDTSGDDVPSSFKDFAQANLPQWGGETSADISANLISGISVLVNALVLAFNTAKVGDFGAETLSGMMIPADAISMAWIAGCVALVGTQTFTNLSTITSVLVFGLFASFAGLLLPGLANLSTGPMELLLHTPGTSPDVLASACQLAPIVLMSLVYQNIVPTVTKMLEYDRRKSIAAITLGSFLPFVMYVAWAFCVVGGGVDTGAGGAGILDGPLMTLFTLTTIAGSSIGCVMSLAEEFDTFVIPSENESNNDGLSSSNDNDNNGDKFSLLSVVLSVASAGVALQFFANDLNGGLKVAGSFGSPLLYGVLPVVMAWTQRQQRAENVNVNVNNLPRASAPLLALELPTASLGLLGVASTGFVGNELLQSAQEVFATL